MRQVAGRSRGAKPAAPRPGRAGRALDADRMQAALAAARTGVFTCDIEARSFWCSPEFVSIVGRALSFDEATQAIWPVVHPDDADCVRAEVAAWAKDRGSLDVEHRIVLPGGDIRWIHVCGELQGGSAAGSTRIVGLVRDIDQRKRKDVVAAAFRQEEQVKTERTRLAADAARAGLYETDFEHGSFWCSPEFVEIMGRSMTYEEAEQGWPMIHPDDAQAVVQSIIDSAAGAVSGVSNGRVEFRIILPSGDVRWIDSRGEIHWVGERGLRKITGLVLDIDARKRQELALIEARQEAQANAERLKLATDAAGAAIYEIDYEKGVFWCSPEFPGLMGRTLTFEEASRPWPMIYPDDLEQVQKAFERSARNRSAPLERGGREFRILLPSGKTRWVDSRAHIHHNPDGGISKVVGLILDVDQRKRQELAVVEARREAQQIASRLRIALTVAHAGAFEIDFKARTFWCSSEFIDLIGRSLTFEEASGDCWPVIHPEDQAYMRGAAAGAGVTSTSGVSQARVVLPTGETRWIQFYGEFQLTDAGAPLKMIGLALDIDDRKRQELALIEAERAASAAAEAKSQFLSNMSHEIRTPMNGVLGILHLLNLEPLSGEARGMLAEAESCGQMLAQLLNDVIDFSKIEAGRMELSPAPTDVPAMLRSVAGMLRPQAEAKGIELIVQAPGAGGWALMDPVRLRQALFNLIGNAVKFTTKGRVVARLSIREERPSAKRMRFEIEDTGVGIPAAAQAALFQRFQQADGSTARQFGGSGLGLAITRALADIMGGEVGFSSVEGKGSTFWFDVTAPEAEGPDACDEIAPISLLGLRILVVEDNATNRLVATKILESMGASVLTADDGLFGLEAVQADPFDLVLMDVQMPRMDGVEATRRIRSLDGQLARIPIIGLTANALSHQWTSYREAGMDGVVSKPISPAALAAEMTRVLSKHDQAPGDRLGERSGERARA